MTHIAWLNILSKVVSHETIFFWWVGGGCGIDHNYHCSIKAQDWPKCENKAGDQKKNWCTFCELVC